MSPNVFCRALSVSLLVAATCAAVPARAGVVSVAGVLSGQRGDQINPTLVDQLLADLEAADIKLTFDPSVLEFIDAAAGALTSGFDVEPGPSLPNGPYSEVLVSLVTGTTGASGGPGSVLETMFRIKADAPFGASFVRFETLDASLYAFDTIEATINVRRVPGGTVPLPGTSPLVLWALGAAAVAAAMRRRARS